MRVGIITCLLLLLSVESYAPFIELKSTRNLQVEIQKRVHKDMLIASIMDVESNHRAVINRKEQAYGKLQIRQMYLDEAYRLSHQRYSLGEMMVDSLAIKVFAIIIGYHAPSYNIDTVCAVHNAGNKNAISLTTIYRNKVKKAYEKRFKLYYGQGQDYTVWYKAQSPLSIYHYK